MVLSLYLLFSVETIQSTVWPAGYHQVVYLTTLMKAKGFMEVLRGDAAQALRCRVQAISAQIGDADMVYATAVGSLLRRELQTYAFYLRRDGLRFVWRMIRNFKWRHVKLVLVYLGSRLFSRRHYELR